MKLPFLNNYPIQKICQEKDILNFLLFCELYLFVLHTATARRTKKVQKSFSNLFIYLWNIVKVEKQDKLFFGIFDRICMRNDGTSIYNQLIMNYKPEVVDLFINYLRLIK